MPHGVSDFGVLRGLGFRVEGCGLRVSRPFRGQGFGKQDSVHGVQKGFRVSVGHVLLFNIFWVPGLVWEFELSEASGEKLQP